jgi:hypothetical protein
MNRRQVIIGTISAIVVGTAAKAQPIDTSEFTFVGYVYNNFDDVVCHPIVKWDTTIIENSRFISQEMMKRTWAKTARVWKRGNELRIRFIGELKRDRITYNLVTGKITYMDNGALYE